MSQLSVGEQVRCQHSSFVIFHGTEAFKCNHLTIELTLVEHTSHSAPQVLEVIAYDSMLREEANRIYLNLDVLEKQLADQLLGTKLQLEIERLEKAGQSLDSKDKEALSQQIMLDLKIDFVLTRIHLNSKNHSNVEKLKNIVEHKDSDNAWGISLISHFLDGKNAQGQLEVICEKPAGLMPGVIQRPKPVEAKGGWSMLKKLVVNGAPEGYSNTASLQQKRESSTRKHFETIPEGTALHAESNDDIKVHEATGSSALHGNQQPQVLNRKKSFTDDDLPAPGIGQGTHHVSIRNLLRSARNSISSAAASAGADEQQQIGNMPSKPAVEQMPINTLIPLLRTCSVAFQDIDAPVESSTLHPLKRQPVHVDEDSPTSVLFHHHITTNNKCDDQQASCKERCNSSVHLPPLHAPSSNGALHREASSSMRHADSNSSVHLGTIRQASVRSRNESSVHHHFHAAASSAHKLDAVPQQLSLRIH